MPKCAYCKKVLKHKEAYRLDLGVTETGRKSSRYYCSQEEYEESKRIKAEAERKKEKNKEDQAAVYTEIMKYFPAITMVNSLPRTVFMEMSAIASYYGWEKMLECLTRDEDYITRALDKDFPTEVSKGKYLAAIIRNGCEKGQRNVVVRESIIKQSEEDFTMPEPVLQPKKRVPQRKGFDDLLEEL